MKKVIAILIALVIAIAGIYYLMNYSGVWPSLLNTPTNITDLIQSGKNPLSIPEGFQLSVYAANLSKPRTLIKDPNGVILVSDLSGAVYAMPDKDHNGEADSIKKLAENLDNPHGLALYCQASCTLFVAESHQLSSYSYDPVQLSLSGQKQLVKLPASGGHSTRSLLLLPETKQLLISIGSSCNVCLESDPHRAAILITDFDGTNAKVFASGLRNSVFLRKNPLDGLIYATDMGRDYLGDDLPPDELNVLEADKDYGWPVCYGKNIHDLDFDHNYYFADPCMGKQTPALEFPAHSAPLGFDFFSGANWPADLKGDMLVAFHGSWNRSVPTGYKIVKYEFADGQYRNPQVFMDGWLDGSSSFGRPVDILIGDNDIFISDDHAGVVYKLTYQP
jgi:glucose/arabinose dehydrogenase